MCQNLEIAPIIDMFASWHHHELPCYFYVDSKDTHADGYYAFNYHLASNVVLYKNTP